MEKIILSLVILFMLSCPAFAGLKGKIDSGNGRYFKGDFEGALSKYQDAEIDEPEHPVLHFNSGDALVKLEKYEEAIKSYEKATYSKDIDVQSKSYYNMGNALYLSGKLPESIQLYQKCLELNPNDQDAKYNIEFVRKKIKEQIDKNKQEGKEGKEGKDGKEKKEEKEKAKEAKENKDKKEGEQKEQGEEKKPKMSKEDAERILKAVNEDEKKALEKNKEKNNGKFEWGTVEQDW